MSEEKLNKGGGAAAGAAIGACFGGPVGALVGGGIGYLFGFKKMAKGAGAVAVGLVDQGLKLQERQVEQFEKEAKKATREVEEMTRDL